MSNLQSVIDEAKKMAREKGVPVYVNRAVYLSEDPLGEPAVYYPSEHGDTRFIKKVLPDGTVENPPVQDPFARVNHG